MVPAMLLAFRDAPGADCTGARRFRCTGIACIVTRRGVNDAKPVTPGRRTRPIDITPRNPVDTLRPMLPYLVPVVLLELVLLAVALRDLLRRDRVNGSKWLWGVIIVCVQIVGPIAYFVFGRGDE